MYGVQQRKYLIFDCLYKECFTEITNSVIYYDNLTNGLTFLWIFLLLMKKVPSDSVVIYSFRICTFLKIHWAVIKLS